jgi:hypothetical protein
VFVRGAFPGLLPERAPPEELLSLCWSHWPAGDGSPEPMLLLLDDLPLGDQPGDQWGSASERPAWQRRSPCIRERWRS